MISGLYSAATAMEVAGIRHEATAENLANIQMAGFRRRVIPQSSFESLMQGNVQQDLPKTSGLGTAVRPVHYDFQQGSLDQTGRPIDMAIVGDGFFEVQTPDGALYTRNGSFYVNADRQLVTIDQLPVQGNGGPIVLPNDATTENISVTSDGQLSVNGNEFAQLKLVRFNDVSLLTPRGATLFEAPITAGAEPSMASVQQGWLELSNVSSMEEMVNLIDNTRQYEAAQKAMTAIAEAVQKRIGLR